jgi:hypothetical protein
MDQGAFSQGGELDAYLLPLESCIRASKMLVRHMNDSNVRQSQIVTLTPQEVESALRLDFVRP